MKKQRKIPGRLKVLRTTVRALGPPSLREANGAYCYAWPTLGGSCVTCNGPICDGPDCDYTR